jgi:potassium-transporting ATPase potassium-binding subunit
MANPIGSMTLHSWLNMALHFAILLLCVKPLGIYIANVMEGKLGFAARIESIVYRICGIRPSEEMHWSRYAISLLIFTLLGTLAVYALQRLQLWLPLNPQRMANVTPDSSFNSAVSFISNTNWQGYVGEATMSNLTQMLGFAVQNFLSAASGIVVAIALIRGLARHSLNTIGNVWVDLARVTLFILLPLSFVLALAMVSQGTIQSFDAYVDATTLEITNYSMPKLDANGQPVKDDQGNAVTEPASTQTQTLPMAPLASQDAIKMLGTNGGGIFNVNSTHPYENPTPFSNFLQMLAIFLIPSALCYTFGRMVGDTRQGWAMLVTMIVLFLPFAIGAMHFEQQGNPLFNSLGIDQSVSALQAGGNMEGKETRFGIADSGLFAAITTAASCGAVNSMHDSFTPLGGMMPFGLMQLGEVVFGGVGTGLYGMLVFALLAVFIAGLMIGRTPEYVGKKIEAYDMKMISVAILVTPLLVLAGTAIAVVTSSGTASIFNPGTHGFSEVYYAFTSAGNNNGSAFAGLSANVPFYNVMLAIAMWFGRFGVIVPVLAIAGSLAAKKRIAATAGTMPTHGPLFVILLAGTVILVGALNYVPGLALGPIAEHLQLFPLPAGVK